MRKTPSLSGGMKVWRARGVQNPLNRTMYHLFNQMLPLGKYSTAKLFNETTIIGHLYQKSFGGIPSDIDTSSDLFRRMELATRPTVSAAQCGKFDTAASAGDGAWYAWCVRLLQKLRGRPGAAGLSYGISTWDNWSKRLANEYNISTVLYDCYCTEANCGATPSLEGYLAPSKRQAICVGGEDFVGNGGEVFEKMAKHLSLRPSSGTLVKIDVEGSEWAALQSLSDEDLQKIDMLNLKVYFCDKPKETIADEVIGIPEQALILERLRTFFELTARSPKKFEDSLGSTEAKLCSKSHGWASLSYINKLRLAELVAR